MVGKLFFCVLGKNGVGKTTILTYYTFRCFTRDYDPNMEDCFEISSTVDQEEVKADLFDSSGYEFLAMRELYMKKSDGFILVYSITDEESFLHLQSIIEHIYTLKQNKSVPILIAGAKCDLEYQRAVTIYAGFQFAKNHNCLFFETSAKLTTNIDEAINTLLKETVKRKIQDAQQNEISAKKSKNCVIF